MILNGNGPKLVLRGRDQSYYLTFITHKNKSGKKSTEDKHSPVPGVRYNVKDTDDIVSSAIWPSFF